MKSEKGLVEIIIVIILALLIIAVISIFGIIIYQNVSYGKKEGIIINKYYKGPYTTTTYVMSGKVMIPITNYHSESWNFELQKEVNGKNKNITVEVTENMYNKYNIGDYFEESEEKIN